jgi:arylsulfatase A-like enzyme
MNIFMILEDALRPDRLGCYGYPRDTSPNIDRLAREGVVFENCIATASHTFPPIVSILMGQTTATHGLVNAERYARWGSSAAWQDRTTPLTLLQRAGWRIDGELVLRWRPLGFRCDTDGKEIEAYFAEHRREPWFFLAEPYPTHLPYDPPAEYFRRFLPAGYAPSEGTRRRLEVVRSRLIVHPSGVLSRLEAGGKDPLPDSQSDEAHKRTAGTADFVPELDRPAVNALYDGEVRVFDDLVGRWVRKLEELDLLDDTLIVILADHGEELLERGHVGHCSCNLKGTLYDESIRIPLILRLPGKLPAGRVVRRQVSQVDIMPTLLQLAGLDIPDFVEGSSLLPLIRGEADRFREEAFAETTPAGWQSLPEDDREIWCVRTARWKLILNTDTAGRTRRFELYDLQADPGETRDLYRADHPALPPLEAPLQAFIARARQAVV